VNNKFENMRKEEVVAYFMPSLLSLSMSAETEENETFVKITGLRTEI
jgi:hypothetical protein